MGLITTKYEVGDMVVILSPRIAAQVMAVVYNGYTVLYRLVYWLNGNAFFYEAYDYELEVLDGEQQSEQLEDDDEAIYPG